MPSKNSDELAFDSVAVNLVAATIEERAADGWEISHIFHWKRLKSG